MMFAVEGAEEKAIVGGDPEGQAQPVPSWLPVQVTGMVVRKMDVVAVLGLTAM